jgi:hypothetical protein
MPLKLTNTSQHWFSNREFHGLIDANAAAYSGNSTAQWVIGTVTTPAWPFFNLSPTKVTSGNVVGGTTPAMMGDNFGYISIAGINVAASIVFKMKLVLELKVQAFSSYAPHLRPPPFMDQAAISNYFKIVREMPDAWPAEYNDAGRILRAISGVVKTIGPLLTPVPYVGPALAAISGPASMVLDGIAGGVEKRNAAGSRNQRAQPASTRRAPRKKPLVTMTVPTSNGGAKQLAITAGPRRRRPQRN